MKYKFIIYFTDLNIKLIITNITAVLSLPFSTDCFSQQNQSNRAEKAEITEVAETRAWGCLTEAWSSPDILIPGLRFFLTSEKSWMFVVMVVGRRILD